MFSSYFMKAQDNTSLFLMNGQNGRVFNINSLGGGNLTNNSGVTTLSSAARNNLAVGINPTNVSATFFTASNNTSGSPVYVANASIGTTLPKAVNGFTANPNTGPTKGYVYGLSDDKNLVKASPSPALNLGLVTGDALWTNAATTVSGDGFFDNAGKMYVVAYNGSNKYLYKIDIATRVATFVIQLSGNLPSKFEGLAFYNGKIYGVQGYTARIIIILGSTFNARLYEINPNTGVSIIKDTYQLNGQLGPFQGSDDLDLASGQIYVPSAAPTCNELFGVNTATATIYRIDVNTLATTAVATGSTTNNGNMAYGPIVGNLSQNQFVTSRNANSGVIYTGTSSSGSTTLTATSNTWGSPIGIGTDPSTGIIYGIANKALTKWIGTGNASSEGNITGDADWTSGTTLNDIAVDNGGNLYCITSVSDTKIYLYRVNPNTKVATKIVQLSGSVPELATSNGNGLAYLGDFFYYSRIENSDTKVWKLDPLTGISTLVGTISGKAFGDLASCATVTNIPAAFTFNCSSTEGGLQNGPFIKDGTVQNDILRVPVSGAVNGEASITISGSGITTSPSPYIAFVGQGTTFIDVPVSYNGTSNAGTVSVSVSSGQASGSCSISVSIVEAKTDLQITKTSDVSAATFGSTITFTIKAKNNGPIPSFTTNVTDTWPAGLTFVSATPSKGTVDLGTGVWSMGDLQVNEEATLILTGTINTTSTNSAVIVGNYTDPNTSNNTAAATVTLTVTLDAIADSFTATGTQAVNGATSVGNALSNDTYNGGAAGSATTSNVNITVVTPAVAIITGKPVPALNASTGVVSIPEGTPAGTYTITYKICDKSGTPCDQVSSTIEVAKPAISAVADTVTITAEGGITESVLTNDTFNGVGATSSNVTASQVGTWTTGIILNADGTVTVAAGTPPGSYALEYSICDKINGTANCKTIGVTVNVTTAVNAVNDNLTATGAQSLSGVASVGNVLGNDTFNGGAAGSATASNVTIAVTTAATSINGGPVPTLDTATGVVSIPAGTPAGTYTIAYQLCDLATGTPCDSASTEIIVSNPSITAVAETTSITANGGTTPTLLANDTFNGTNATTSNVTITTGGTTWPTGITLNPDGTVTVDAGTPVGSNTVSYQICDILNPTNCSTVTTTIVVTTAVNAVADNFTATGSEAVNGAINVGNALANDTYNGGAAGSASTSNVAISVTTAATPVTTGAPVPTLDTTSGEITIPAGTPAGTYSITYQVCDKVAGTPCDSSTISVVVDAPALAAAADNLTSTANGGTTTSVLENDTYNGGAEGSATTANVTVTQNGSWPIGVTLNADGTITVAAGTLPADYSVSYQICDQLNPTNCTTATTIVKVTSTVNAVTDNFSVTGNEALEGITNLGNVLANDNINAGAPGSATIDNVTITVTNAATPASPGGLVPSLDPATGIVSVPVGTPAGLYIITYQICDQATGILCSITKVDVLISDATLCYKLPITDASAGSELDSRVGISALARTGVASTWPGIRKSGWIVLEAKTKGFVINRVKFNVENKPVANDETTLVITNPVEGMMVFDITNNCLKVYTYKDAILGWYCMETQTCPE